MIRRELAEIRGMVDRVLENDPFPDRIRPGFLRDAVLAYPSRPGKSLRPALLVWCCELLGGRREQCPRAATAVELYHNWTLIHDDIIDRDDTRRGGPSCHRLIEQSPELEHAGAATAAEFARNQAMLAGDILHGWSMDCLLRSAQDGVAPGVALALGERMSGTLTPLLASGEALDVLFELDPTVPADDVLAMLRLKTATLLRFAAEAGASIATGTAGFAEAPVRTAGDFAEAAGMAFQIQDDILGLFGDPERLKKPVASDVRAGKPTLLYLEALARAKADDARELRNALGNESLTPEGTKRVREIVRQSGALEHVRNAAKQYVTRARTVLETFSASPHRERLEAWMTALVDRES